MTEAWIMHGGVAFCVMGVNILARLIMRWSADRKVFTRSFALEGDHSDAMVHLLITDLIRQNGHRIVRTAPQFIFGNPFDYPAFFHKLLSHVPRARLERWEWLVVPVIETLHVGVVFAFCDTVLLSREGVEATQAMLTAGLIALAFVWTPQFYANPARQPVFSERPFGYLLTDIWLMSLAAGMMTGSYAWLLLGVPAFAGLASSSKFSIQAAVALSLGMALFTLGVEPVVWLVASLTFAVVASRGYVVRVVRGMIRHSRFYRTTAVKVHPYTGSFNNTGLRQGVREMGAAARRYDLDGVLAATRRHPLLRLPITMPWLGLAFVTILGQPWSNGDPVLISWMLAGLTAAVLTTTDRLKFLGEGERYLEYALCPMLLLVALGPCPVQILGVVILVANLRNWTRLLRSDVPKPQISDELREVCRFVRGMPPTVLSTIPLRLAFPLCYGSRHQTPWLLANYPGDHEAPRFEAFYRALTPNLFIAPDSLPLLHETYGVGIIVIDKWTLDWIADKMGMHYDLSSFPILFENRKYIVVNAQTRKDKVEEGEV